MADVDQLFKEYVAQHRAGADANPLPYLERVQGADRRELAALIDAYLVRSPGKPWNEDAYRGSAAEQLTKSLTETLAGASGAWPVLLPQLRHRAKLKREELVRRLASALGIPGREERVAYYYNQMEHGRLPPQGVSDRVLEALAAIVDTTKDALRRAGEAVAPPAPDADDAVFARLSTPDAAYDATRAPAAQGRAAEPERDEVDELFLGG